MATWHGFVYLTFSIDVFARRIVGWRVSAWRGPWRSLETVEFATPAWVDWFNTRRLLEPIGYVPPAEYEARYYEERAKVA